MAKRIFIIGAGRFGLHLANRLCELGCEVILGDTNQVRVKDLAADGFHTIEMDSTEEDALRESGALDADVVIVAIGENMQGSILTSLLLKQLGAKQVAARALDSKHAQVLQRLGVDDVILPTRDAAHRLAERLYDGGQGERHPLAADYLLAQVRLGSALEGKTLAEAELPTRYGLTAVLMKRQEGARLIVEEARAAVRLLAGAELFVVGTRKKISHFERECGDKAPV